LGLSGFLATPGAIIRISCRDVSSTRGKMLFNSIGNSKESWHYRSRVQSSNEKSLLLRGSIANEIAKRTRDLRQAGGARGIRTLARARLRRHSAISPAPQMKNPSKSLTQKD
jgi:hypothetical protein